MYKILEFDNQSLCKDKILSAVFFLPFHPIEILVVSFMNQHANASIRDKYRTNLLFKLC